jgi:hypothetical protein
VRKVAYSAKRGGRITVTVRAPAAGTLRITVRVRVGRKQVVVASGSARVRKAGTVTVTLRPTRAGRAALRKAKRPVLTATAVLRATTSR